MVGLVWSHVSSNISIIQATIDDSLCWNEVLWTHFHHVHICYCCLFLISIFLQPKSSGCGGFLLAATPYFGPDQGSRSSTCGRDRWARTREEAAIRSHQPSPCSSYSHGIRVWNSSPHLPNITMASTQRISGIFKIAGIVYDQSLNWKIQVIYMTWWKTPCFSGGRFPAPEAARAPMGILEEWTGGIWRQFSF